MPQPATAAGAFELPSLPYTIGLVGATRRQIPIPVRPDKPLARNSRPVTVPDARRKFGHPQDMETGGRPEFDMCAAVDVHYLSTGGARAAAMLAADAAFTHVLAERTALVSRVLSYRPGQFYLRELPPLHAVLDDLTGLALLVIDGYADLDPVGRPGLGGACARRVRLRVVRRYGSTRNAAR